jgi:hypothetical protein
VVFGHLQPTSASFSDSTYRFAAFNQMERVLLFCSSRSQMFATSSFLRREQMPLQPRCSIPSFLRASSPSNVLLNSSANRCTRVGAHQVSRTILLSQNRAHDYSVCAARSRFADAGRFAAEENDAARCVHLSRNVPDKMKGEELRPRAGRQQRRHLQLPPLKVL